MASQELRNFGTSDARPCAANRQVGHRRRAGRVAIVAGPTFRTRCRRLVAAVIGDEGA